MLRLLGGVATGVLLAVADGDEQAAAVGRQVGDRVGLFLRVDDFGVDGPANGGGRCAVPRVASGPSPTARWSCSSTLPATGGTSWVPIPEVVD